MNFRFLSKMYASAIYVFFLNLVTCKQTTRRTVIFGYECYDCYAVRHRLKSVIIILCFIVSFVHFYVCQSIHLVIFPQKNHVNKNSCLPLYVLNFLVQSAILRNSTSMSSMLCVPWVGTCSS